jgi:hypothetical protein
MRGPYAEKPPLEPVMISGRYGMVSRVGSLTEVERGQGVMGGTYKGGDILGCLIVRIYG